MASLATDATQQQRQRDVLLGRQFGDELTELEHETEPITTQRTALGLSQLVHPRSRRTDLAGIGHQDARQTVQQRRFA